MGSIDFKIDQSIAIITLSNPQKHNAVDAEMREGLNQAYERIEQDDAIRVAIICGAGSEAFCAGGLIEGYLEDNAFGPGGTGPPAVTRPWPATKPFIAAINGFALGGGFALALACDLRIVGRNAAIGPTGLKHGAVQGAQTIARLTRLIGASRALQILLLSKSLTGEEAAAAGLAQLVDDDKVMATAMDCARTIAAFSPWTVAMTKKLVYEAQHLPLDEAIAAEDKVALEAYRRVDALEGFRAFSKRRTPRF
jgi:enoyl-CoA hydratase/carnithine racemase